MTITTAPPLSDQDVAAITQLLKESVAAVLAGDWDKWLGMFDDDIVLMPPGAPVVVQHVRHQVAISRDPTGHGAEPAALTGYAFPEYPALPCQCLLRLLGPSRRHQESRSSR